MNRRYRTIAVLIIAMAMAGVASFGVYRTVQKMPVQQVEVANYKVVVAAKAMRMGTRLTDRDVKLVAWPNSSPVPRSHSDVKELIDRGLLAAVVENEPLTESKLAPLQAGAGLSPTIPQGMRAMSVKVNEVVGVAGFVVPGAKVDVLGTLKRQDESITRTVVTNVQVLTAGTKTDQDKAKDGQPIPATVVTLMVTPEDAERITLAQAQGQIMLALRNPLDTDSPETRGARTANLFQQPGLSAPAVTERVAKAAVRKSRPVAQVVAAAPAPRIYTVEAIRAAKRTEEVVR
jgi:pilus assembly protein CpaB